MATTSAEEFIRDNVGDANMTVNCSVLPFHRVVGLYCGSNVSFIRGT